MRVTELKILILPGCADAGDSNPRVLPGCADAGDSNPRVLNVCNQ